MSSIYNSLKLNHNLNNPIILDLGANIGLEAKKIYETFINRSPKVILVEPLISNIYI